MSEEQNTELTKKWAGNECYDRSMYKNRAMPKLKCDVSNGVYSNTDSPGKHVSRQRDLLGTSNIIAYKLRLFINNYFNYGKDRTLLNLIKNYDNANVMQIVSNCFVREIIAMEIQ